jgi:hypothetical protein
MNISTGCYSFARWGPLASATSTRTPWLPPETKVQQRPRRQRRRRSELGSDAAPCRCSFPLPRSGAGPRSLTRLFNHLAADRQGREHGRILHSTLICTCSRRDHIGGVTPSRPTRHARPCSVPSGCLIPPRPIPRMSVKGTGHRVNSAGSTSAACPLHLRFRCKTLVETIDDP